MKSTYLLTGMPGSGKTTLIKEVVTPLGKRAGGFYTEEIRIQGIRQGFRIITLDGQTANLSHINIQSCFRVSKYGVDIRGLEEVGIAALQQAFQERDLVVIDEIGKMELFSDRFKSVVLEIIESGHKVLGTIMLKPDPWADIVKQKPQVKVLNLTRSNRPQILKEVQDWLKAGL